MTSLPIHRVTAHNISREAENKIHDDTVARRFGFRGALVPGAEVYAYMTNLPVQLWGREWLERGTAECRFHRPVYDGEIVTVTGTHHDRVVRVKVESRGELCAETTARLVEASESPPTLAAFAKRPPATARVPADETSLATGVDLGTRVLAITPDYWAQYLRDVRESAPIYGQERLVHPGLMLRVCNAALTANVILGPWIHVGSEVRHFAAACVGDDLVVRARVIANYERKGHRFVDLDALVIANEVTPIARVKHIAIYRPRQVAEAS